MSRPSLLNCLCLGLQPDCITWLMNNTGNSLLMALLFHWSFNIVSVGFLPITTVIPAYIIFILLAWALVFGLLRRYGTERLVRLPATD